jgi:hypothetical protein
MERLQIILFFLFEMKTQTKFMCLPALNQKIMDVSQDLRLSISDAIVSHIIFLQRLHFSEVTSFPLLRRSTTFVEM